MESENDKSGGAAGGGKESGNGKRPAAVPDKKKDRGVEGQKKERKGSKKNKENKTKKEEKKEPGRTLEDREEEGLAANLLVGEDGAPGAYLTFALIDA